MKFPFSKQHVKISPFQKEKVGRDSDMRQRGGLQWEVQSILMSEEPPQKTGDPFW